MITGGGSWMSLWAARRLMEDGWQVELFDIDADAMGKVMAELGKSNQANAQELDVTVIDDVRAAVAGIIERHGSLDALINVAGITNWAAGGRKDFLDTTPDEWDRLLAGNFKGMLNCCHSVIPQMRKQKSGSIVSMAASRGLRGGPGAAIYSTAKAAIILFTQMVSTELGPYGIRVNSIAPGNTDSRWKAELPERNLEQVLPLGRPTSPEDVGNAIAFLVSDRASHITGSCMDVSGGTTLH
jgi:NAD(P)-dependent dehydrogenase (short-subunit alcohol dehydrogenase family)